MQCQPSQPCLHALLEGGWRLLQNSEVFLSREQGMLSWQNCHSLSCHISCLFSSTEWSKFHISLWLIFYDSFLLWLTYLKKIINAQSAMGIYWGTISFKAHFMMNNFLTGFLPSFLCYAFSNQAQTNVWMLVDGEILFWLYESSVKKGRIWIWNHYAVFWWPCKLCADMHPQSAINIKSHKFPPIIRSPSMRYIRCY